MFSLKTKCLALLGSLTIGAAAVMAQDSATLLDLLVRKGIVTDQEAEDLRADLSKENVAAMVSTAKGPNLDKLVINGRIQAQFVSLNGDVEGPVADPATINHFFLRRVYLGVKPQFANGWSSYLNYDFAGSTFDAAYIEWKKSDALVFQIGLTKAPIGYEESQVSSGALKSIERSGATRYFVESNNGRRLGAGSYRQGVFLSGKQGNFSYDLAMTNPEREESSAGASGTGSSANNHFAYWGRLQYANTFAEGRGKFKLGTATGILPDQGGKTLGAGNDLTVASVYSEIYYGPFTVMGEYFWSDNQKGASATADSNGTAFWIQPSYRFGPYEAVVRFSHVDSDGRGVLVSDGVRSAPAPSSVSFDVLDEWFAGLNWYILGNETKHDVKLQAGYVYGKNSDRLSGVVTEATVDGFRSQLQVNF